MQLLGLGALAFALPPALWGIRLMRTHELRNGGLRLTLWVVGFLAASAVASALPPTTRWPLPTGLGGVAGDALMSLARVTVGAVFGPASALVGFVYAGIAILALTAACRDGTETGEDRHEDAPPQRSRVRQREEDEPSLVFYRSARSRRPCWMLASPSAGA